MTLHSGIWPLAAIISVLAVSCGNSGGTSSFSPAEYVNPFIGASTSTDKAGSYHGLGKTFPGATTPFGMVQVSPNTISGGDNAPGYSYEHETIEGFALTQMSGVGWFGDMGNFLVMPTTGTFHAIAGKEDGSIFGYRSAYDKQTETARAGYYSADLTDYGIKAETTATPHCGVMRFTYPAADTARIQVDLAHRAGGTAIEQNIRMINDSTFTGWILCTPDGGGWGDGDGKVGYTLYFYGQLNRPMTDYGFWSADIPEGANRHLNDVQSPEYLANIAASEIIRGKKELTGKHIGFFTEFPSTEGEQVEMKVGISYVDEEGARKNFMAEVDGKGFDDVAATAAAEWNRHLGKIKIEGGTDDDKTVFYTSLYHTMIDPRECSDVDGRYRAGDNSIANSDGHYTRRTVFSGWDVFRSQFPLQTIINPRVVSDEINSLIDLASETGNEYYERWELLNSYSGCMIGNPALPVIADAYAKGIRTFNAPLALHYAENTSNRFGTTDLGYAPEGLSISNTLEYAYADWCAAQLARELGNDSLANELERRGQAYRNVFNHEAGWFCPRYADGSWAEWDPEESLTQEWFGCIECNPFQQGWFVPHDVSGMTELMGGRERTITMLDSLFASTPEDIKWNNYYNHANEPVHFVPFIYNRLGEPWKTQRTTRWICDKAYFNRVEGLVGNEDAGQMSAWYVLAAAGIHPSCPGDNRMEITSPVFDRIEFALDPEYHGGKKFTIIAHDNSPENIYINRATLNGKEYDRCYLDFEDISNGGTLELFMAPEPNKDWGTAEK
ncbi:MAG: glycoside hydrolase family 92 protein [Bacteroidales bacterium]|nr:glycoside hydrolase family 92 protein [Bacteroidales bacterium]